MPPVGLDTQAAEVLARRSAKSKERYVDLRVVWREWGSTDEKVPTPGAPIILDAGGRWDTVAGEYSGDGKTCLEMFCQPAQYETARWFAEWLPVYLAGGPRPKRWRKWTWANVGGRRSGKTDIAVKGATTLCAARAETIVWACSPTEDDTIELHDVFCRLIPPSWAEYKESELRWYWANGSVIEYRSGFKPKNLKRGRVDFALLNEGQYFPRRSYNMVRSAIDDTGGLVAMCANPPDEPVGQWLLDWYEQVKGGDQSTAQLFELDPELNPVITPEAREDLKHDLGADDYRRDALGEFIPIGDLVWYSWSPRYNVRPAGELRARENGVAALPLPDITREFTRRHLGREFDHVIGMDFQLVPHMAAVPAKFFRDPDDPADALMWATGCVTVEGTELELAEELLEDYPPETTALIVDASGWWQDGERTKGRGSVDLLKKAGYRFIFRPDRRAKRNPHIFERVQATNGRMCNQLGQRRAFSVPENTELNIALKSWENRNGVPYRRSQFAHLSDAYSYIVWRIWPRKSTRKRKLGLEKVERRRSQREREFESF